MNPVNSESGDRPGTNDSAKMTGNEFDHAIEQCVKMLLDGQAISRDAAHQFFAAVVNGDIDDIRLASAISSIKVRGQTVDELTGAATALLQSATHFPALEFPCADIVGTGGDGHNTINLSTIAAITAGACGMKVVKHGNRSISSVSGSFDLLEKLNVPFDVSPETSHSLLQRFGICFLYAPLYHPGVRHAAVVRKRLKTRTIFNLLGPLVNPARPERMLLGVADPVLLNPMANVLGNLGCKNAFVVHGSGVDEVAVHGETQIVQLENGAIHQYTVGPEDFGCRMFSLDQLVCHQAEESHQRSISVLSGSGSDAENSAVAVNVAVLGRLFGNLDLKTGFSVAMDCLKSGSPMKLVQRMAESI